MVNLSFGVVLPIHTMTWPSWSTSWMHCLECHHLSMVLHFCGVVSQPGISSTIMEFLRPSLVVTVCSDVDDGWVDNHIRFIDIDRNALVHSVHMTYQQGQHFEIIGAIPIWGRQSLACHLCDLPGLGLFDMRTGELRHVCQIHLLNFLAHVPREGLIVSSSGSGLSLFDDENLALSGSISLPGPAADDVDVVTSVMGGFMHDLLASCVVVGCRLWGLHIVDVQQRAIIRTISLPRLPVPHYPAYINSLKNLALSASGLQVAVTRYKHLFVVDLRVNEYAYKHYSLGSAPTCVSFVGDCRLVCSIGDDINILDITSGEWLHQFHLRDGYYPTWCAKLPNSDWVAVACLEEVDQDDGCLYKIQIEPPFMVEFICEVCVESLFLE